MAKFKPVMGSYETILELFESNEYQEGDSFEKTIRPQNFDEYIGQSDVKEYAGRE